MTNSAIFRLHEALRCQLLILPDLSSLSLRLYTSCLHSPATAFSFMQMKKLKGDSRIVVHLFFLSPFAVHDLTWSVHAGDLPGFLHRLFFLFKTMDHRLVMVQHMPLVAFLIPLNTVYPFSDDF